ncbi:hypothetical protein [Halomarina pelagica]|uniref:hypothetical protein n=1 Tax=Halomarina pelagica TaxID=2961599 RepID=UPI0020C35AA9|nr:hypothetical protein [Halomarina sp. BND7]
MDGDESRHIRLASAIGTDYRGTSGPAVEWVLVDGNRLVITGVLSAAVGALTYLLIQFDLLLVGPGSTLPTLLGSGITSGLLTLITVALSINQLILSRVFGSPNGLGERLDATIDFRSTVEDVADRPSSPNDPATFIAFVGRTMGEQIDRLRASMAGNSADGEGTLDEYLSAMEGYADGLADTYEHDGSTVALLSSLLGPAYADNLVATKHVLKQRHHLLPAEANDHLEKVYELLKAIAIMRQFFKTMAIQRDLARLSRRLVFLGLFALLVTVWLTLVETRSDVAIPAGLLPVVVSVAFAIIASPVALLGAYMIRIATVSLFSVSVGPFIPPEERSSMGSDGR